jgi:hypothetical protein
MKRYIGLTAAELATNMTTPLSPSPPVSGSTFTRCCSTNRVRLKVPVRLTASVKSHTSNGCGLLFASIIFAAVPEPAQLMTPPRGAPVFDAHFAVLSTADAISSRLVISVLKNMTLDINVSSIGGVARSIIDTNAFWSRRSRTVASPSPEDLSNKILRWVRQGGTIRTLQKQQKSCSQSSFRCC